MTQEADALEAAETANESAIADAVTEIETLTAQAAKAADNGDAAAMADVTAKLTAATAKLRAAAPAPTEQPAS